MLIPGKWLSNEMEFIKIKDIDKCQAIIMRTLFVRKII